MAVPRSRILDLVRAQCQIFHTVFNPEGIRTGNKILRQRLRGPSLAAYYPRKVTSIQDLFKQYPDQAGIDEFEAERVDHVRITKARGKGAPKKKRTAAVKQGRGKR